MSAAYVCGGVLIGMLSRATPGEIGWMFAGIAGFIMIAVAAVHDRRG